MKSSYYIKRIISEIYIHKHYYNVCILHFSNDYSVGPINSQWIKPCRYKLYKYKVKSKNYVKT